jgi:hypothetical protein
MSLDELSGSEKARIAAESVQEKIKPKNNPGLNVYHGPTAEQMRDVAQVRAKFKGMEIDGALRHHQQQMQSDRGWNANITGDGVIKPGPREARTAKERERLAQEEMKAARRQMDSVEERLKQLEVAKQQKAMQARQAREVRSGRYDPIMMDIKSLPSVKEQQEEYNKIRAQRGEKPIPREQFDDYNTKLLLAKMRAASEDL